MMTHISGMSLDLTDSEDNSFKGWENVNSVDTEGNSATKSENKRRKFMKDQPIKEITNVPRYNLRRFSDAKVSLHGPTTFHSPKKNSELPSENELNSLTSKATTLKVEEPPDKVRLKFYVETQPPNTSSSSSLLYTVFDEVWAKIKVSSLHLANLTTVENTELIPCKSSIVNLIIERNGKNFKGSNCKVAREKIVDLPSAKQALVTFQKQRSVDYSEAFRNFSTTIRRYNSVTLCWAMTEILGNHVDKNEKIQENILQEFVMLSTKIDINIFDGFVETLKNHLKGAMSAKESKVKINIRGYLVNSTRLMGKFFTRLCKLTGDHSSVVSILRDTLFYFKFRAHPIAHSVIEEWPEVFPQDCSQRNLVSCIILFGLVNHKMEYNKDLFKLDEIRELINRLYSVKLGMKTAEDYAKEIMLKFYDDTWIDAITLLCKRQMFPWAYSNVIMKYFLPILNKWKKESFAEEILCRILIALRVLLQSCPLSERENKIYSLDTIINSLKQILLDERGSRKLKEIIISILFDLSSMRFSLCSDVLRSWRPADGYISTELVQQLQTKTIKNFRNNKFNKSKKSQKNGTKRRRNESENEEITIAVGISNKSKVNYSDANSMKKNQKKRPKVR